jgi:hypothetical protein
MWGEAFALEDRPAAIRFSALARDQMSIKRKSISADGKIGLRSPPIQLRIFAPGSPAQNVHA